MNKKERVLAAIHHQPVDRIPRGELAFEGEFSARLLKDIKTPMSPMEREVCVRNMLDVDLVDIHEFPRKLMGYADDGYPIYQSPYGDIFKETPHSCHMLKPALEDIEDVDNFEPADLSVATAFMLDYYKKNTDFFLFCQLNGPVSALDWSLGMEDYMCYCMTDPDLVAQLADKIMEFELGRARMFLDRGADAILIGDDIAFNTGTLLPPDKMEIVAYPFYRKMVSTIKAYKNVPVMFHSDGYLYDEIPKLIDCGFDAIQSLQPSAGMDIAKIKKNFGDQICLMGNVDLNYLLPFGSPEEVRAEVCRLAEEVGPEGFILSTCNIMTDAVPVENAKAMYFFDR